MVTKDITTTDQDTKCSLDIITTKDTMDHTITIDIKDTIGTMVIANIIQEYMSQDQTMTDLNPMTLKLNLYVRLQ